MKILLKPKFRMTPEEIEGFRALPNNLPNIPLTKKQKDFVSGLYYKYIERHIDNARWGTPLYMVEKSEKWPSGDRMKEHEAKRISLNPLVEYQDKIEVPVTYAVNLFRMALACRTVYQNVIYNIYEIVGEQGD